MGLRNSTIVRRFPFALLPPNVKTKLIDEYLDDRSAKALVCSFKGALGLVISTNKYRCWHNEQGISTIVCSTGLTGFDPEFAVVSSRALVYCFSTDEGGATGIYEFDLHNPTKPARRIYKVRWQGDERMCLSIDEKMLFFAEMLYSVTPKTTLISVCLASGAITKYYPSISGEPLGLYNLSAIDIAQDKVFYLQAFDDSNSTNAGKLYRYNAVNNVTTCIFTLQDPQNRQYERVFPMIKREDGVTNLVLVITQGGGGCYYNELQILCVETGVAQLFSTPFMSYQSNTASSMAKITRKNKETLIFVHHRKVTEFDVVTKKCRLLSMFDTRLFSGGVGGCAERTYILNSNGEVYCLPEDQELESFWTSCS